MKFKELDKDIMFASVIGIIGIVGGVAALIKERKDFKEFTKMSNNLEKQREEILAHFKAVDN